MSFFRYPGGKSKLKNQIVNQYLTSVSSEAYVEYREPFFGGGSIGLCLMDKMPNNKRIWINDYDVGISCLWTAVINHPEILKKHILSFKPSIERFYEFKLSLIETSSAPTSTKSICQLGFQKLALHQISYSGLGVKSGGPLGGRKQKSKYKIDCRWSPDYICKKVDKINKLFSSFNIRNGGCTSLDFSTLIEDVGEKSLLYCDPPYYDRGNDLYKCGFSVFDHQRLADLLMNTNHYWALSYDDCKEIRDLYKWAEIILLDVNYTITSLKDKDTGERRSRMTQELLIIPKKMMRLLENKYNVQTEVGRAGDREDFLWK